MRMRRRTGVNMKRRRDAWLCVSYLMSISSNKDKETNKSVISDEKVFYENMLFMLFKFTINNEQIIQKYSIFRRRFQIIFKIDCNSSWAHCSIHSLFSTGKCNLADYFLCNYHK